MFPFSLWMLPNWSWFWVFVGLFLFRNVRLWVNLAANWLYTPIQPVEEPTVTAQDMTVIIPTVAEDIQQLKETVQTAYRLEPYELLLVTPDSRVKRLYQMVEEMGSPKRIQILSISQANKRRQLSRAIPEVQTKITLLLDDDVWLPEKFTKWILAPFEDPRVGGVGTNQQLRRNDRSNLWEFLGALYLVRRNFDCTACNWMDGGLPCLSGRAVAYRSEILQDPNFTYGFTHETWGSDHFLNADDDNFITRWLFSHDWKIQIQNHRECEVETTLENDSKYLRQCLRWVRSNWRSNLTSLSELHMWVNYPWSLYAVFQTTITQWAFLYDCALFATFYLALLEAGYYQDSHSESNSHLPLLWTFFLGHYAFTKTIKLIPHLLRNPGDVRFVPVSVLFGYFHNAIKLYGCITVTETTWGTREGADADDNIRMIPIPPMATITPPLTPSPQVQGRMLRERGGIVSDVVS
ncbi:glycosyltransferase family 2 protein [Aaosphaeria arxii CBS 175.79]|uniref:Glycosyltransferase family 2 protein n=1 Tax=Aaosphaeria arxii CBS 175.79 TaxID=1450172 RepID=A0A6A5XWG8_9PLEO|nr:glycosyltransferase family 2 protein [Aaosphaeria arxii CBS 175.79]KAF2017668.1 glycosyltransferase family 2 protein [Aaosphaeria arxii CBS 175.79]